MSKPALWVVEMLCDWIDESWEPTVAVSLNPNDGRVKLAIWKRNNPQDRFRLVKYERIAKC